eukprot:928002-Prorocentrum_minimum.AAC.1
MRILFDIVTIVFVGDMSYLSAIYRYKRTPRSPGGALRAPARRPSPGRRVGGAGWRGASPRPPRACRPGERGVHRQEGEFTVRRGNLPSEGAIDRQEGELTVRRGN